MTRILVGIDGSEGSKSALAWAIEEAMTYPSATVVAMAVWFAAPPVSSPWLGAPVIPIDLHEPTAELLEATVRKVAPASARRVELEQRVVQGPPAPTLIEETERCDLVVVGTRGLGGFKELVLGSVSHQLAHHAHCPVVIVPLADTEPRAMPPRIVVGVDGSQHSLAALRWAARRAHATGSTIRATFVWQRLPVAATSPSAAAHEEIDRARRHSGAVVLDDLLAEAHLANDVTVDRVSVEGDPAKVLIDEARGAELLVVGARGHGGFASLLVGSVANTVTHHPPCPVAVIRDY